MISIFTLKKPLNSTQHKSTAIKDEDGEECDMKTYKSFAELKGMAKEQLLGKYPCAISVQLLTFLLPCLFLLAETMFLFPIQNPISEDISSILLSIFMGILQSGNAFFYLNLTCRRPVYASDLLEGFRLYPLKALGLQAVLVIVFQIFDLLGSFTLNLVRNPSANLLLLLCSSVLTIAACIFFILVRLMYSQVFFLLQDFPEYSLTELLRTSRNMMQGHKGRLFYITVSFLPFYLLVLLSFGLAMLWLYPYQNAVKANFYMDLIQQNGRKAKESVS